MKKTILALCLAAGFASSSAYSIDLAEAIASAEKGDPQLASAFANRDAAFDNIAIAKARLLPQANAQTSFQKLQEGVRQEGSYAAASKQYDVSSYNYTLSLRQAIYHPRDLAGLDIGKLQAEYGNQKLSSARSDLWLRITNAWLDVLVANEQRRLYQSAISGTGEAAEQAKRLFEAGDGTRDAVFEAQAQLELARSLLLEADMNARSKGEAFRLLTGLLADSMATWRLPDFRAISIGIVSKSDFQLAVENANPEIQAAQTVYEVNRKRVEQAKADRLPVVDFVASRSWAQSDTISTLNQLYNITAAGFQVSIPLFLGGGLEATERQSVNVAQASAEDLRAQKLKLAAQIEADWSNWQSSVERARSAEILVQSAMEQRNAAMMGLKSHLRTWADVAQSEILISRRASDFLNFAANGLRYQARLLSLLPVTDYVWEPWVAQVSVLAKP